MQLMHDASDALHLTSCNMMVTMVEFKVEAA
jgi:hypothetical protein